MVTIKTTIELLPPSHPLETKRVLKQSARAHRALAELKGFSSTMPNKNILINAVTINEAKDSAEIENIVTTHDDIFKAIARGRYGTPAAKEVVNYRTALWHGYEQVKASGLLTLNTIAAIQELIVGNRAGIRTQGGTVLRKESTGETVYTPPASPDEIMFLLGNLESYINDELDNIDPLVKLAVIHYQFEAIHPFYDGNGRTGRIINVLYLVLKELLGSPILYLSKYIIRNKAAYYRLLQEVRTKRKWEDWILYILEGIEQTAEETMKLVKAITETMENTASKIREQLPKVYSRDLVDLLFYEFYIKIGYFGEGLGITRKTASNYLSELERAGFLTSHKLGREKIYVNNKLFEVVRDAGMAQ